MQEVDEAIQKAEITSLTMEKIKLPETNDYPEANASTKLSPEKVSYFYFDSQLTVHFLYLIIHLHFVTCVFGGNYVPASKNAMRKK